MRLHLQQVLKCNQAVDAFHADVEQDDVGLEALRKTRQLRALSRFAQDGVSRHVCNQRSHAGSDKGVVVDQ